MPALHPNQAKIRANAKRFNVVACGRRWGKTVLGIDLVVEAAAAGKYVGWFAPEYKLLLDAWREIKSICRPIVSRISEQEKRIELRTGGSIDCWAFDNNENAGRSRRYHRVVIDEAAHCKGLDTAWTKGVRPTLADFRGDAWFLSSPNGENTFHALYMRGVNRARGWSSWHQTSYDNPFILRSEIDDARDELPGMAFRQEWLAEFIAENHDRLIPDSWIDRCYLARRQDGANGGLRWLAMDVSKGPGKDRKVAFVGDSLGLLACEVSNRIDLPGAANLVATLSRRWGVPHDRIAYDAGGWAGPELGRYLEAVGITSAAPYFGSGSGKVRFANARSRCAWALRQRLTPDRPTMLDPPRTDPHSFLPEVSHTRTPTPATSDVQPPFAIPPEVIGQHWAGLRDELRALRYRYDGKIELEAKADLVSRLGHSPDLADTLIIAASHWRA